MSFINEKARILHFEIDKRREEIEFFRLALLSLRGMEKAGTFDRNIDIAKKVVVNGLSCSRAGQLYGVHKSNVPDIVNGICKQLNTLVYATGNRDFQGNARISFLRDHASDFFPENQETNE